MKENNQFLKVVMKTIYMQRRPLAVEPITVVRHEIADGKPMCEVWFMTKGCEYDRTGGCVMCNYGKGHNVDSEAVLRQLKNSFNELPEENYNLVVNPSGSFLDENEVRRELRQGIYGLLDHISFESLTVESRADIVTLPLLKELREHYPGKKVSVEIGVETMNPWLLKNAVNKGTTVEKIKNAVDMVHDAGLLCVANIGLGLPFINERTNIDTACQSIIKALDIGFDSAILFPYHVKPGTLLDIMYANGRYKCVSLWAIAAALKNLPAEAVPSTNISWYRNYYTDKSKIVSSPETCPECAEKVLQLLDEYKAMPSADILEKLDDFKCYCHEEWKKEIANQSNKIDFRKVESDYKFIAEYFHMEKSLLKNELKSMEDGYYAYNL